VPHHSALTDTVDTARNQYHGRSKYYSQYLQLAISIAVDMRLDRKSIHHKSANAGSKRNPVSEKVPAQTWGPEEQRAAAGIFYISSTCVQWASVMYSRLT
jgi:hypothetical protein